MTSFNQILPGCSLLCLLVFATGCRESSGPPAPLTVEQLPAEFDQAFARAAAEPKALAGQVVSAVRSQDYGQAFLELQRLTGQSGLSKAQTQLAARGLLTLNGLLQSAQAKGDEQAKAVLTYQRSIK